MSRATILASIRSALSVPMPEAHHHPTPARAVSPAKAWPKPIEEFQARFEALGGLWHPADGAGAAATVARLAPGGTVLVARDEAGLLDRLGLPEALAAAGLRVVRDLAELADVNECCLTVTAADWAVAESGTFALLSSAGQGRLASLIAPIHVVVFTATRVVARLTDVLAGARDHLGSGRSSGLLLVTGPSRTGDIESQLIVGVHGPQEVHAVLVAGGGPGLSVMPASPIRS